MYINNSDQFVADSHDTNGIQTIGGITGNAFNFSTDATGTHSNAIAVYIDGSLVQGDIPVTTIWGLYNNTSSNNDIGILLENLGVGFEPNVLVVNIGGGNAACTAGAACEAVLSAANGGMNVDNEDGATIF